MIGYLARVVPDGLEIAVGPRRVASRSFA